MSSTATLAAGMFASESGQRLLHILLQLGDRGFKGLYDKCMHNLEGEYYQTGLRRASSWSEGVIREDIDYVKQACPDLEETFGACFVSYVADRYRGRKRPTVQCPPLVNFVKSFYESLGAHESLATGDYFVKRDPVLKRVACMDACRTALYGLMSAETVRIELLSEVGEGSVVAAKYARAPPSVVSTASKAQHHQTLEEASRAGVDLSDDVVKPEDSISQVGRNNTNTTPRRTPAVPPSVPPTQEEEPRPHTPPPRSRVEEAQRSASPEPVVVSRPHTPPRMSEASSSPPPAPRKAESVVSSHHEPRKAESVVSRHEPRRAESVVHEPPPRRAESVVSRHEPRAESVVHEPPRAESVVSRHEPRRTEAHRDTPRRSEPQLQRTESFRPVSPPRRAESVASGARSPRKVERAPPPSPPRDPPRRRYDEAIPKRTVASSGESVVSIGVKGQR